MSLSPNTQDLEYKKFREIGTSGTTAVAITIESMGTAVGNDLGSGTFAIRTDDATLHGGEDLTNDVQGVLMKPVVSATYAPSDDTNFGAAKGTGFLIKASAGNVFSVYATSGTAAIRYFQLFNQGTVPVVGQTPVASYPMGSVPAGGLSVLSLDSTHFAPSKYFTVGIAAAFSSTQGTLGTASITAADYSWHIKYG